MVHHDELHLVPPAWVAAYRRLPRWAQVVACLVLTAAWVAYAREVYFQEPSPGAPVLAFWDIIILVGVLVATMFLMQPKVDRERARPKGLGDFQFPTATEGRPVPLLFGRCMISGPNVVWYGDLAQDPITQRQKVSPFKKVSVVVGYRYRLGMQMAICRGPGVELLRVFVDDQEIFNGAIGGEGRFDVNEPELFGGDEFGNGGLFATVDFYPGTTTQSVSAYLDTAARQRVTTAATQTAPRYTGTSYLVARELTGAAPSATDRGAILGNSTQIQPWKFEAQRFPGLFAGQGAGENKIGTADCNPMNVAYELLTNKEWGRGFPASDIDVGPGSSFLAAADTLRTEGNGFSMVLDQQMTAADLKREIERQIDGSIFLDPRIGKWAVKLVRADYDVDLIPQLDDSNISEIREPHRATWESTTNFVQAQFNDRADLYKESYAPAHDVANATISSGGDSLNPNAKPTNIAFPGVKIASLAANLAWRELRAMSHPLFIATLVVNRESWDLALGDAFAWTSARLGFTKLPMRVNQIDYGLLQDGKITISATQDVFGFEAASMGTPPQTDWTPPTVGLVAFPADEQLAFEAPRALVVRDPDFAGDDQVAKVLVAARRQGGESAFVIGQRNAVGAPAGSFAEDATVFGFMRIGALDADLAAGTAIPTATVTINPTPDGQTALLEVFFAGATLQDLGVSLTHLILVDNEFMLVQSAAAAGGDVDLQNVYRGALDTAQGNHTAGADVYLIFVGLGITDTTFPPTNNVDVELRMRSAVATYAGAVTVISRTLNRRTIRPYPPASTSYNGSGTAFNTPNMEGDGSGLNGVGFAVSWRRRRYDTGDEVASLLADDTGIDGTTEYRVSVFVDPDGANVLAFQSAWVAGPSLGTFPTQVQIVNEAAAGTELRIQVETRHDLAGFTDLVALQNMIHDVVPTSPRTSQFYLGGDLAAGVISNAYTATVTATHTVNIGAAYSSSNVEARINGGAFAVVIAAGLTTGTIVGVNATDTIELRHTVNEAPARQFVEINDGVGDKAYGCLTDNS